LSFSLSSGKGKKQKQDPGNPVNPACPPISLEGLKTFFVERIKLLIFMQESASARSIMS
jgi:hypothetical protein